MSMSSANMQASVAEEVNRRLVKATEEIGAKYASGQGGMDDPSVNGPTGAAYKEKAVQENRRKQIEREKRLAGDREDKENSARPQGQDEDAEEGDQDEDSDLRELREARLRQLKNMQREKLENIGKGHGQYREIVQDEFLKEVTSSMRVICHFYHRDFNRCTIMDHHLQKLAQRHVEAKFIKINAEKTPFFVEKLKIRSMPTVAIFNDGVCVDKIIGFTGLSDQMPEGKEDEWPTIILARLLASKNAIDSSAVVDDDGIEAAMKARMEQMRKEGYQGLLASNLLDIEDDDDFSDL